MKIDHLTFLGTSYLRDTLSINLHTITLLKDFQIRSFGEQTLRVPRTVFSVRVKTFEQGACFDLLKMGVTTFTNFCCFEPYHREEILERAQEAADRLPYTGTPVKIPKTGEFLYTIPVFPQILNPDEVHTAAEIQFYLYYSLYLGRKKHATLH